MRALDRFQPCRGVVGVRDADPVGFEHRRVNVLPGEVSIRPEHISADVAPHHELDDALRDLFLNEMGDAAVPEDVGGDMLLNARTLGDNLEMLVDGRMDEGLAVHVHEDQGVPARVRLVAGPPLCQVFVGHDEPDVPGHVCLEVHVRNNAVFIEREIAPGHGPNLADAEPSFVQRHDESPLHGTGGCFHHSIDLIRCQQVRSHLGHGILGRYPEFAELALAEIRILVLDHPEVELFEDGNKIGNCVLLEWALTAALCCSQFRDCRVQITDGVARKGPDEPAPGNQGKREFVRPPYADVLAGPELRDEFPDQGRISLGKEKFLNGVPD